MNSSTEGALSASEDGLGTVLSDSTGIMDSSQLVGVQNAELQNEKNKLQLERDKFQLERDKFQLEKEKFQFQIQEEKTRLQEVKTWLQWEETRHQFEEAERLEKQKQEIATDANLAKTLALADGIA